MEGVVRRRLAIRACAVLALCLGACGFTGDRADGPAAAGRGDSASVHAGDASSAQTQKIEVWAADPSLRIQPTTPAAAGAGRRIAVEGARASYESYQLAVRAPTVRLDDVNIVASDLVDDRGRSIAASNVTLFREWFIDFAGITADGGTQPAPQNSPTRDSRVADPLIPFMDPYSGKALGAPFSVAPGTTQPIWIDVFIAPNVTAGEYTGTLTVTSAGQQPVVVPIGVTVWNLSLPDYRAVPTFFQMDIDPLINFHRDTWACQGSSCYLDWRPQTRDIVHRYEELAHSHRIDVGQAMVSAPGRSADCEVPSDWGDYDAAMRPYMDGSYFADHIPSARLQVPLTPGATYGDQTCGQARYKAIAKAWADHLKSQGWFDRALIFAEDEPPPAVWPEVAKHAGWIVEASPDWKSHIIATTAAGRTSAAILDPVLGVYVTCLKCYDDWYLTDDPPYGRKQWPARIQQGIKLWFYESNAQVAPYPTFAANTLDGNEPRIMLWGTWFEGATGFLYWQINQWTLKNAWGPNVEYGVTGDGVLVYPGNHDGLLKGAGSPDGVSLDGPVPSIRLKQIRTALQDWALFALAAERGKAPYVRNQIAQIYSQLGGCAWRGCAPINGRFYWQSDEARMQEIRRNIVKALN